MNDQSEDTCQPVEVDGQLIRVRGAGPFTETERQLAAEIVRAAKRKFDAEPITVQLRQEIAGVLRDAPGRWNIRARTDAVMAALDRFLDLGEAEAWCKTCRRVWNGPAHRCDSDAEQRLARLRDCATRLRERGHDAMSATFVLDTIDGRDESARTTANNPATSKDS